MTIERSAVIDAAPQAPRPSWPEVEKVISVLAREKTPFETGTSTSNRITSYERGQRLMLESDSGSAWVDVDCIRECWETFERLGRISRADVLEPGRRSAFMLALFERVSGVEREDAGETYLVLGSSDR